MFLVAPEGSAWRVTVNERKLGRYSTREAAFAAAVQAARRSRATTGAYAWVKVRHPPIRCEAAEPVAIDVPDPDSAPALRQCGQALVV
jgi:hypothetical protein